MDTHHTHDDRLSQLTKSNARWRLLAVSSIALIGGVVIGGMGHAQPDESPKDPKAVVDHVGMENLIVRIHADGSMSYFKFPQGDRTAHGYYNWGEIKIDERYTNRTLPQP